MIIPNRRSFLAGAGALALAGCATRGASPRPPATADVVADPAALGLDAVIDLSHADQVEDFGVARDFAGIRAIIHKASEGFDWLDPLYAERRAAARSAGLLWGAYHFGTFEHSGAEQAQAFLAAAQPDSQTLLALDLELNERNPANSMDLSRAEEFVATLRVATGRLPLLYVQPAWADGEPVGGSQRTLGGAIRPGSLLAACDLWLADYRARPELPSAWGGRGWRLWQYTGGQGASANGPFGNSARAVPGISACDRNVFTGHAEALPGFWAGAPAV